MALRAGVDSVKSVLKGRISAFFTSEIGGLQCVLPLLMAAEAGLPVLDGDGMGRAFPELQMTTFSIYGTTHSLPHVPSGDRGLISMHPTGHDANAVPLRQATSAVTS